MYKMQWDWKRAKPLVHVVLLVSMERPTDFSISTRDFKGFCIKYFSLSSQVNFKNHYNSYKNQVVYYYEVRAFESFEYLRTWHDPLKGDFNDHGIFNVDDRLSNTCNELISSSLISISEKLENKELDRLRFYGSEAQTLVAENEFYKSYPNYVEGIDKLIEFINEIKEFKKTQGPRERKKSTHGEKSAKAYELESLCNKLLVAEDHESAIDIIKEEYPEFKWDNPHRFLRKNNGDPNKSQIARALALVAEIKFDDPPNEETIRATLLK